jgi:hypothetical protein
MNFALEAADRTQGINPGGPKYSPHAVFTVEVILWDKQQFVRSYGDLGAFSEETVYFLQTISSE